MASSKINSGGRGRSLSHSDLLQLKRWNTPTIYNGWEKITARNPAAECFNLEEVRDFMPQMGPMVGYAVTVVIEPGNAAHPKSNPAAWSQYRSYLAEEPGPKIVVVQDLDTPRIFGASFGEVNSNVHRAFGCVGGIIDGAIRDLDEMTNSGFKALARRLCVGHACSHPIRWNCPVTVFGCAVAPGDLIHADKHGFLVIPSEDQARLLEAARFMDANECNTLIAAARDAMGKSAAEILESIDAAAIEFKKAGQKFKGSGEW